MTVGATGGMGRCGITGASWPGVTAWAAGFFRLAVTEGTSGVVATAGVTLTGGASTGAGGTERISGVGSGGASAGLCNGKYLQLLKMQRQLSAKTALLIIVYTGFTVVMT